MVALTKNLMETLPTNDGKTCRARGRKARGASERFRGRLSLHEAAACEGAFPRHRQSRQSEALPKGASARKAGGADKFITVYIREVGLLKPLTSPEEGQLALRAKQGDKLARAQLLKGSLPLVVEIAREYENIGLPLLDLVSEGNLGLVKALERFDPLQGDSFSTFAAWWIKQAIKRALGGASKTSRLPALRRDQAKN